jgi:hypothetical protein
VKPLVLTTVVSADAFAGYLPLYHYAAMRFLSDWHIRTFVRGKLPVEVSKLYDRICREMPAFERPRENWCEIPEGMGRHPFSTNVTRWFLDNREFEDLDPKYVLITDADLLLFQDPLSWHLLQMTQSGNDTFACHHGPWKKPYRPEISPEGWGGNFERVAGGFVLVTPAGFDKTREARYKYRDMMAHDRLPFEMFREADEVILGRILKESQLPMPKEKRFPAELRGVHAGDFKSSMTHRWTNTAKMAGILTNFNILSFRTLECDPVYQEILYSLRGNALVTETLANARAHMSLRGM